MAAAYEDLLGADNAISGEARYCLSLWGIHEGLLEKGGSDSTTKYNMLKVQSYELHGTSFYPGRSFTISEPLQSAVI